MHDLSRHSMSEHCSLVNRWITLVHTSTTDCTVLLFSSCSLSIHFTDMK